jgi:uncharacterized membrane protein YqjE
MEDVERTRQDGRFRRTFLYAAAILGYVALTTLLTYPLVRHITGNELASFVGGVVFTFCPYKFAHLLGHVHLVSTHWIPFYALFVLRMTTEASRRIRHALYSGLFLTLIGYTVIFLSVLAVRRHWRKRPSVRFWAVTCLVFLVLSMGPYLRVLGHKIVPWRDTSLHRLPEPRLPDPGASARRDLPG